MSELGESRKSAKRNSILVEKRLKILEALKTKRQVDVVKEFGISKEWLLQFCFLRGDEVVVTAQSAGPTMELPLVITYTVLIRFWVEYNCNWLEFGYFD